MDTDMDMDVPLPDELEWLEAQSRLQEEDPLDPQPPVPYHYPPEGDEEDEGEERTFWGNRTSPPPKSAPSVKEQLESHKRPSQEEIAGPIKKKRSEIADREDDAEEDWLLYAPLPETSHTEPREEEILEPEEVAISRYASQIDGECVPVTAPGGDRVYAKICRFDIDLRPKKLDTRARSDGTFALLPYLFVVTFSFVMIFALVRNIMKESELCSIKFQASQGN